jgi:hypothetical protein
MRMVVVNGISGEYDPVTNTMKGHEIAPYGRLILRDNKIVGEILATALLPQGFELDGIRVYQRMLNDYIYKKNFYSYLVPFTMLYGLDPQVQPELWLTFLHKVYPECSEYRDWDDEHYRSLPMGRIEFLEKLRKNAELEQKLRI